MIFLLLCTKKTKSLLWKHIFEILFLVIGFVFFVQSRKHIISTWNFSWMLKTCLCSLQKKLIFLSGQEQVCSGAKTSPSKLSPFPRNKLTYPRKKNAYRSNKIIRMRLYSMSNDQLTGQPINTTSGSTKVLSWSPSIVLCFSTFFLDKKH